jgi:hypothetical protein
MLNINGLIAEPCRFFLGRSESDRCLFSKFI